MIRGEVDKPVEIRGEAAFDGKEHVIGFVRGQIPDPPVEIRGKAAFDGQEHNRPKMVSPYSVTGDFTWTLSLKDHNAAENWVQLKQTTCLEIYVVHHRVGQVEWFKGGHIPVALLRHVVLPYNGTVDYRRFLVDCVFNTEHVPFAYNSVNGGSRFGMGYTGGSFYLSDWLKLIGAPRQPRHDEQYAPNYQVNCYDQAAIVQICLAFAFGGDAGHCWRYLKPFGYIGHAQFQTGTVDPQPRLIGWEPSTANASAQIVEGSERSSFGNHAFVQDPQGHVLDACAGPHYGDEDMDQYIRNAIDHTTPAKERGTVKQVQKNCTGVYMLNEKFGVTVERESMDFVSDVIGGAGATSSDKVYDNSLAINLLKAVAQKAVDANAEAAINPDKVKVDSGAVYAEQYFEPPPEDKISFWVSVAVFPNNTLAEKAIVVHLNSYGKLQNMWKTWGANEREGVDVVLVRDDNTRNSVFLLVNGNALVELWTHSSKPHAVTSKQLTAMAEEVAKFLGHTVNAAANVEQPEPSLAIEGMSPGSDGNYQLYVDNKFRVKWSPQTAYMDMTWQVQEGHVVCTRKDKKNGALLFDARTAGTETITVWLGYDQARGPVKTQVKLSIQ
ncbi:hypothetical protein C8R45DRAFT_1102953 [Mycena sanguinolenta]|nr:hypothetical protein C8R45DRAFT_1102953 [Mycena sanguinolenta]